MNTHLAQEWSAAWPLPAVALALLVVLSFLRPVVDPAERGRVKAGIFFAGAYLLMQLAFGLLHRPLPAPEQHDWLRVLSVLLLCFAVVIAVEPAAVRRRCSGGARSRASCRTSSRRSPTSSSPRSC